MADDPFPRDRVATMMRRLPAYLRLSWRLTRDPLLSRARRAAVIGAAGYLASPIDLVPGRDPGPRAAGRHRRCPCRDPPRPGGPAARSGAGSTSTRSAWPTRTWPPTCGPSEPPRHGSRGPGSGATGRGMRVTGRGAQAAGRGAQAGGRAAAKGARAGRTRVERDGRRSRLERRDPRREPPSRASRAAGSATCRPRRFPWSTRGTGRRRTDAGGRPMRNLGLYQADRPSTRVAAMHAASATDRVTRPNARSGLATSVRTRPGRAGAVSACNDARAGGGPPPGRAPGCARARGPGRRSRRAASRWSPCQWFWRSKPSRLS